MKRITIFASLLTSLFLSATAVAQEDLTKEITVETDYTPHERKAKKLNLLPAVSKPPKTTGNISYSEWSVPTDVPATAPLMMPYGYMTSHDFSHYRGYLDLAAGSYANIAANAGYAIVAKPETMLNIWLQHNSTWSGRNRSENLPEDLTEPLKQKFNNNIIALDFSHRFHSGTFSASAMCHFDHFNYYGGYGFVSYHTDNATGLNGDNILVPDYHTNGWNSSDSMQTVNEFAIALGWRNNRSDDAFKYSANIIFSHFGFSKSVNKSIGNKGLGDNRFALSVSGETNHRSDLNFGADARFEYLGRNFPELEHILGAPTPPEYLKHTDGMGLITISPFARYAKDKLSARVGANVQFSMSDGSSIRISPNVSLSYAASSAFAIELKATGGKSITTLSDIYSQNRYLCPISPLSNPYVPVDAELSLRIGPFTGFYAKLLAGYGIFKDMPLPLITPYDLDDYCTTYEPSEIKGWKAGFELGYRYNSLVDARLGLTYSPQELDKGYFLGFDRAKCVADFNVTITPIEKLKVNLGYQLRAKRSSAKSTNVNDPTDASNQISTVNLYDIGTVSNLSLGASYQVTKMLSVFASGSNLLGKKWDNYYSLGAQGFTLMAGASLVF